GRKEGRAAAGWRSGGREAASLTMRSRGSGACAARNEPRILKQAGPMPKLDRYLSAEFARAVFAALVVLGMVSLGGVFADLIGEMARGKVPPPLLLSQLGLRMLRYLPLIMPLGLLVGLLLAVGRLYRDSEMHVLHAVGVGPVRLLRP